MSGIRDQLKIFAGNSNLPLAEEIAGHLEVGLGEVVVETFSDGETKVEIKENVRGGDVFVIQSTCAPGNDHLMELLLMLDAFKRASAMRITAVIPYYGYARQDRKVLPRVPISAKLVADLLTTAGASRILTLDLHSGQIQGFFNVPVDNLTRRRCCSTTSSAAWIATRSRWSLPMRGESNGRAISRRGSTPRWRSSTRGGRDRTSSPR
jgi:ribose-phosphate pyrophosphokinase